MPRHSRQPLSGPALEKGEARRIVAQLRTGSQARMEIFRRQEVPEPENEQIPAARLQTDDTVLCPGDYAPQTALRRTAPVVAMIEIKFARNDLFQAGPICFRFPNRNSGKGGFE